MRKPIDQTCTIEEIATRMPPRTWETVFADAKPELHDVSSILDEQERTYGQYYPLKQDIFAAFNYTPLPNVKVVIIGQDPYHQTINVSGQALPRAVGLSFSVRQEDSIPSSLQNIYAELANTVRGFKCPDHGDLREWGRQGVLLLNMCLTVRPGQANQHGDIWLGLMNKVFKAIALVNPYCVYLLWGREAQKVKPMLGERSVILEAAHPSGLSARRGFFGCNHFNLANDALIRQGKVGINWRLSKLSELRSTVNTGNRIELVLPPANTDHKPQLAPVDVATLPTIIPLKQNGVGIIPQSSSTQPVQIPMLPIIPNITLTGLHTVDMSKNLAVLPMDNIPPVPTASEAVPAIPKIQFQLSTPVSVMTGMPQIITAKRSPAHAVIPGPRTVGLPLIPMIIQ